MRRLPAILLLATTAPAALTTGAVWVANDALRLLAPTTPSEAVGSVSDGSLLNGRRLPTTGPNFSTYSRLGAALGRTTVHSTVHDVLLDAFDALATSHPDHHWVLGETGWPSGGPFPPHRTHQNGLAVDLMTPLAVGTRPVRLPRSPLNLWGYATDLDDDGHLGTAHLDAPGLAALLDALDTAARAHDARITKVILAPDLQPLLDDAPGGAALRRRLPMSRTRAWVRHDDHIHVVFAL